MTQLALRRSWRLKIGSWEAMSSRQFSIATLSVNNTATRTLVESLVAVLLFANGMLVHRRDAELGIGLSVLEKSALASPAEAIS